MISGQWCRPGSQLGRFLLSQVRGYKLRRHHAKKETEHLTFADWETASLYQRQRILMKASG